jgi:DNA-binding MarR family transcriptional regulator
MNKTDGTSQEAIRRFSWEITSIGVHLEEIRNFWARSLGISGPQWMIMMALSDLDQDQGVPVNAVAKMLHVDSSFVTTQSKILEKKGFVRRKPSETDARVVQMSLTDRAYKQLASLAQKEEAISQFILEEFNESELSDLTRKLGTLKKRLEKACLKMTLEA